MKSVAIVILLLHVTWILAVIFGAFFTRGRPVWSVLHVACLIWGIVVEAAPVPCPLTMAEQYFETRAGWDVYQGSFMLHYIDKMVYPDMPWWMIGTAGVAVCVVNLGIYAWRFRRWVKSRD